MTRRFPDDVGAEPRAAADESVIAIARDVIAKDAAILDRLANA